MFTEKTPITERVTFLYERFDEDGNQVVQLERTAINGDAEYLPVLLDEFTFFLKGMTFDYVSAVATLDSDGEITHSSTL